MCTSLPPLVLLGSSKRHPFCLYVRMGMRACVSKCPQSCWFRATLMALFYLDHLCKDLISK